MKEEIIAPVVDTSVAPQAIRKDRLVYISTQTPIVNGTLIAPDASSQIEQVFANFRFVLEAGGGSPEHVVQVVIYLTDMANLAQVSEKMKLFFPHPYPACTVLQARKLPDGGQIAMEGVADLNESI